MSKYNKKSEEQRQYDIERVKHAYTRTSKALTDVTIQDTISALGLDLDPQALLHLEHWAVLSKFDQALGGLVELRSQMFRALQEIGSIRAGITQAQAIAFKTFADDLQECFDQAPLPDPFLNDSTTPYKDSKK